MKGSLSKVVVSVEGELSMAWGIYLHNLWQTKPALQKDMIFHKGGHSNGVLL